MRRIEIASKTRNESGKISDYRVAQRNAVRADQVTVKYFEDMEILNSKMSRRQRWERRLGSSALAADQVNACISSNTDLASMESHSSRKSKGMHAALLKELIRDNPEQLRELRSLKRELVLQNKQLKAMKDVERVNSRLLG